MKILKKIKPKLITFDVYSALVDINSGLTPKFSNLTGISEEKSLAFIIDWRKVQLHTAQLSNSLDNRRITFYNCTKLSLDYVCKKHNLEIEEDKKLKLIFAWNSLPLWPEASEVISNLIIKGYKVAILSNGDQNMLEEMNKGYDFNFDYILSSETNEYYKPHPSIYDLPKNILGFSKKETLHIAGSAVDVMGCVSSGLPCYWSNRKNDILIDTKFSPEYEFSDLTRLNNLLK